uniref:Uncharacterized protein n=1 Tax=Setaria italica TaxID=4555 RepID=K3YZF7_SETIT
MWSNDFFSLACHPGKPKRGRTEFIFFRQIKENLSPTDRPLPPVREIASRHRQGHETNGKRARTPATAGSCSAATAFNSSPHKVIKPSAFSSVIGANPQLRRRSRQQRSGS